MLTDYSVNSLHLHMLHRYFYGVAPRYFKGDEDKKHLYANVMSYIAAVFFSHQIIDNEAPPNFRFFAPSVRFKTKRETTDINLPASAYAADILNLWVIQSIKKDARWLSQRNEHGHILRLDSFARLEGYQRLASLMKAAEREYKGFRIKELVEGKDYEVLPIALPSKKKLVRINMSSFALGVIGPVMGNCLKDRADQYMNTIDYLYLICGERGAMHVVVAVKDATVVELRSKQNAYAPNYWPQIEKSMKEMNWRLTDLHQFTGFLRHDGQTHNILNIPSHITPKDLWICDTKQPIVFPERLLIREVFGLSRYKSPIDLPSISAREVWLDRDEFDVGSIRSWASPFWAIDLYIDEALLLCPLPQDAHASRVTVFKKNLLAVPRNRIYQFGLGYKPEIIEQYSWQDFYNIFNAEPVKPSATVRRVDIIARQNNAGD